MLYHHGDTPPPPLQEGSSIPERTEKNDLYEQFKGVEIFTIRTAVCAWCERTPGLSYMFDKAENPELGVVEQTIVSEYKAGKIPLDHSDNVLRSLGHYEESYITREDLLKVADKRGERPKFLFPEGN